MNHKVWSLFVVIATLLLLFVVATINYMIDPYAQYREPKGYVTNQRLLLPGLSEHLKYESIIIGTSMTENFNQEQINSLFGTKVMKLSIAGSSLKEQYEIANRSIEFGPELKKVFWGLDFFKFNLDNYNYNKSDIPEYLLDKSWENDYKYLISLKTLKESFELYNYNENVTPDSSNNIVNKWEDYAYWGGLHEFDENLVLEDYKELLANEENFESFSFEPSETVNKFIKPIIVDNPEIEFNLFLTSPSILYYLYANKMNENSDEMINEVRRALVNELGYLPNVNLFDFSIEKEWTHNLDNYKDVSHYKPEINKEMMERIFNNENVINSDNVEAINKEFLKQVSSYEAP